MAKTRKPSPVSESDERRVDCRFESLVEGLALDPAFAAVVAEYRARKVTVSGKFGSNGLKVKGKLFALGTQGTLVVKLPKQRVSALVDAGKGEFFNPGHGRLMKEWIMLRVHEREWPALTREACSFVSAAAQV